MTTTRWKHEVLSGGWKYKVKGQHASNRNVEFTLRREAPGRWRVSGRDSDGVRRRVRFNAETIEEAIKQTEEILGYRPPETRSTLAVDEVFVRWLETLSCGENTKRGYIESIDAFLDWVEREVSIVLFADLRLEHIQRYANYLSASGRARNTIRLRMLPIRACSRWALSNWPGEFTDPTAGYKAPQTRKTTYQPEGSTSWSLDQVAEFLVRLESHVIGHKVLLGVALQGLCGLRLLEALRIRWTNIDGDLITIEGEVKNEASVRRIPIPGLVVDLLSDYRNDSTRIVSTYADRRSYSSTVRGLMRDIMGTTIQPRGLRRTIPTEARKRGFYGWAIERYMGHAPSTITDRHYVALSEAEKIQIMRQQVVAHIDEILTTFRAKRHVRGTVDKVLKIR